MTRPQGTSRKLNLPNRATSFAKAKQSTPHLFSGPPGLIRKPVLPSCRGPGKGASALSSPDERTRVEKAGSVPEPGGSPSLGAKRRAAPRRRPAGSATHGPEVHRGALCAEIHDRGRVPGARPRRNYNSRGPSGGRAPPPSGPPSPRSSAQVAGAGVAWVCGRPVESERARGMEPRGADGCFLGDVGRCGRGYGECGRGAGPEAPTAGLLPGGTGASEDTRPAIVTRAAPRAPAGEFWWAEVGGSRSGAASVIPEHLRRALSPAPSARPARCRAGHRRDASVVGLPNCRPTGAPRTLGTARGEGGQSLGQAQSTQEVLCESVLSHCY